MFTALLVLAVLGGLELVAGFAWMMATTGTTRRRSGPEVGAEVFGQMSDGGANEGVNIPLLERSTFRGTGVKVERETEVGYGAIKAALRERRWRDAMPGLLVLTGMTDLCVFGSLALYVGLEEKLVGGVMVAVVLYTFVRIWIGFVRS